MKKSALKTTALVLCMCISTALYSTGNHKPKEIDVTLESINDQLISQIDVTNTAQRGDDNDDIFENGFEPAPVLTVVSSTSFENIDAGKFDGIKYLDTGDASVAHDLVNNPGEPPVDLVSGFEMGVDARYVPYDIPGVGLTDDDFVGITTFTGTVGAFTSGSQGYQLSDSDGNMIVEFDVIDLTNFTNNNIKIDYFIQATGWELDAPGNVDNNDRIKIYVKDLTNATEIDILNTNEVDVDSLGITGQWITGDLNLPDNIMMQLVVELRSNASAEAIYLDTIIVSGQEMVTQ